MACWRPAVVIQCMHVEWAVIVILISGRVRAPGGEWQGLAVNANGREQLTE